MTGEHREVRARRVVIGLNEQGRSCVTSDELTPTRLVGDAFARNDLWQATRVPGPALAENTLGDVAQIPPPPNGYTFNLTTFPPDSEWDYVSGWAQTLKEGGSVEIEGAPPGFHATDTVDLVTVLSGEFIAVLEEGEVHLFPGDSLIQRGTKHAWRNPGQVPATMVAVMIAATT
jgi:mannose-6-phosphate isomerase-like protein (cupin superfamily)